MFRRASLKWAVEKYARMMNFEWTTFVCATGTLFVDRTALVIVNSDIRELGGCPQLVTLDPQLRSMLQWAAASMADIPHIQLSPDRELQQVIVLRPCWILFTISNRFTLWYSLLNLMTFFNRSGQIASMKEIILSMIVDIGFKDKQSCIVVSWFPLQFTLLWRQNHQLIQWLSQTGSIIYSSVGLNLFCVTDLQNPVPWP